ncbi:MAG TPA: excinuclease ABC subunit UvrA [Thermoanaerobaculia bacterium]|nr:excinuclease ABC subunit UvrA [Thermoanaerobaculia bacterium]
MTDSRLQHRALTVTGARTHNLKDVSCAIPHGKVTVVTGPSGAGKSSLVFDTIFAEGQRRFVESMSTYAQQFIQQLERPPVEAMENLLPAVALEAKSSVRNARSTVGSMTEILDLLRLLFANLGESRCPHGHGPARRWTAAAGAGELASGLVGDEILLSVRLPRPRRNADQQLAELMRQGFFRVLDPSGGLERLAPGATWPESRDPLPVVLGRYRARPEDEPRLVEALEQGLRLGPGVVTARGPAGERHIRQQLSCPACGEEVRPPQAALFSFDSPLGACPTCSGFGRTIGVDRRRVVPDPSLALGQRPFAPWNTPSYEEMYDELLVACRRRGVPLDVPWRELPAETRRWVWAGGKGFCGIAPFFEWLEGRTYKVHVRVLLARYRGYFPCPDCGGARLRPEALAVRLCGRSFPELTAMSVEELSAWLGAQRFPAAERALAHHLLATLASRLEVLHRVGLDYLTLDRAARTLSGGETQRIHLAAALGSGLTGTLYALDEPTIGLHPRDSRRLLELMADLARRGNTVLVVEHDPVIIEGADHVIELGPGAGEAGGEVLFAGPVGEMVREGRTLTARYLTRPRPQLARRHLARRRQEKGLRSLGDELARRQRVEILGASAHNLRGIDVAIPLATLVAVTGVSGSGKSTLVEDVLYEGWRAARGEAGAEPGPCRRIEGLQRLGEVVMVDQRPLGRSSRSNPVTTIGAYDELRKLFAATPAARARRLDAGAFSFNLDRGRCPDCRGTGSQEVDLQFMGTLEVVCDRCQGKRFRPDVLAVRLHGRTIAETLELTVSQALERFADQKGLCRKLRLLDSAGLGYLRLGQPTSTLSVGEAQRLKLAAFLRQSGKRGRRLLLFDEPTTGLHLSDIALLYRSLRRLVQGGDTVVVVEHQLDLVARCDWIVDLGPEGGKHGGGLMFCGPLEELLEEGEGPTAEELRRHLSWQPRRRVATA